MNKATIYALKVLRKIYQKAFHKKEIKPSCITDPNQVSELIFSLLTQDKPCMIARFGSVELNAISNYWSIKNNSNQYWEYIKGKIPPFWWQKKGLQEMQINAGFFPTTIKNISRFSEIMIEDMQLVDILGSWRPEELFFQKELFHAHKVSLIFLEPFWSNLPWSRLLENKKVLVVHPFSQTIEKQYLKRELLFKNPQVLPDFSLITLQAVQSLCGSSEFKNWFEALEYMKNEMDKSDYDICLIGCGAYGFPLAAHAKRKGKKAIHLGGALQLLFGIKGKRWEDPNYGFISLKRKGAYPDLMNENWCYPNKLETPKSAQTVESGCYW